MREADPENSVIKTHDDMQMAEPELSKHYGNPGGLNRKSGRPARFSLRAGRETFFPKFGRSGSLRHRIGKRSGESPVRRLEMEMLAFARCAVGASRAGGILNFRRADPVSAATDGIHCVAGLLVFAEF